MHHAAEVDSPFPLSFSSLHPQTLHSNLYRGTSLMRKRTPLGPYRTPMTRVLGGSQTGWRFLMGEVPP